MKKTGLVLDECYKQHKTYDMHPEQVARIDSIKQALIKHDLINKCSLINPIEIDEQLLLLNHSKEYIARLKHAINSGARHIDSIDNSICTNSWKTALLAVGGVIAAIDAIMANDINNCFCVLRPPGHHAERDFSMGFCLLNNIALGAHYLIEKYGCKKVLIFDWDVHHGNGTQHSFEDDPKVFYASIHAHPNTLFPGTGYDKERGSGEGLGYTLNIPLLPGRNDNDYREAFEKQFLPLAEEFAPDFILISAGFDAHVDDPIGNMNLTEDSFRWLTKELKNLATKHCQGRVISLLEGGYNLHALGECAAVHLDELLI